MLKKYLQEELILKAGGRRTIYLSEFAKEIKQFLTDEGFNVEILKNIGHGSFGDVFLETSSPKGTQRVVKVFQSPNDIGYLFNKFDRLSKSNLNNVVKYDKLICREFNSIKLCAITMEKLEKPIINKILLDDSYEEYDNVFDTIMGKVSYFFDVDNEGDIEYNIDLIEDYIEQSIIGDDEQEEVTKFVYNMANAAKELLKIHVPFRDFHDQNYMYDPKTKEYKLIDIL